MLSLDLGLSALQASQIALRTASNNLSNAATPGYHRQVVQLADRPPIVSGRLSLGTGVTVASIRRQIDSAVEAGLLANGSQLADAQVRQSTTTQLETLLTPGEGALTGTVTQLFAALEQLAARPQEPVLLRQVVTAGQSVARELNATLAVLDLQQADLQQQAERAVNEVAELTAQLTQLNPRIAAQRAQGVEPNDLLDQRDALQAQLAEWLDVSAADPLGRTGQLSLAGGMASVGTAPVELSVNTTTTGDLQLQTADSGLPVVPRSGRLAGLLNAHNELVAGVRRDLLEWFDGLRQGFDQLQATGLGSDGAFAQLTAQRTVVDPGAPLTQELPLRADDLFVTLTNNGTGQRTTYRVPIDPSIDSLQDVAARLDALPGFSATLAPPDQRLVLTAASHLRFDFAGRIDPEPVALAVAGTAAPTIHGDYRGGKNAEWQLEVLDSGTVGVTSPLRVQVRDAISGTVLATIDAGLDYEAGTDLELPEGLTLQFGSGILATGDRWGVSPVAEPDGSGLVAALGLRSFFVGGVGGPFTVHPALLARPQTLAVSQSGNTLDAGHLEHFLDLRHRPQYATQESIEDRLATLVSLTGLAQQSTQSETAQLQAIGDGLLIQRDAFSGVDPNEEVLSLLQAQRSFQAASRVISVMQETLADLLRLIS